VGLSFPPSAAELQDSRKSAAQRALSTLSVPTSLQPLEKPWTIQEPLVFEEPWSARNPFVAAVKPPPPPVLVTCNNHTKRSFVSNRCHPVINIHTVCGIVIISVYMEVKNSLAGSKMVSMSLDDSPPSLPSSENAQTIVMSPGALSGESR
jgi:hypothetical protein